MHSHIIVKKEYHIIGEKKIQVYLYLNNEGNIGEQKTNNNTDILEGKKNSRLKIMRLRLENSS